VETLFGDAQESRRLLGRHAAAVRILRKLAAHTLLSLVRTVFGGMPFPSVTWRRLR